jgi:hypothetical protein
LIVRALGNNDVRAADTGKTFLLFLRLF